MSTTETVILPGGSLEIAPAVGPFQTHDVSLVGAHTPSISSVVKLLQSLVDKDWKFRGHYRYSEAHVLLISWADDDLGVLRELQDLESVFTNAFNYNVETWEIPDAKSQRRLQERVTQFVDKHEGTDSLLILYYAGHAIRADGGPVWTARQNPDPRVSTESIPVQALLAECDSDALLLYDCCFATPVPASGSTCGVTEAIAACGFHETAPGVGQDSFTNALVNELGIMSYSAIPTSVGELYQRLVQRLRSDNLNVTFDTDGDIKLDLNGKPIFDGDRRRTPIYYPISNEQKRRQILLAPLVADDMKPASSPESSDTSLRMPHEAADESDNKTSSNGAAHLYPMVLLSIRVESEELGVQTWREWIRDIPEEATDITVQGIYRSCSTLLLLTMPVETWTLLPDNEAYSFVGFVTSTNLAPKLMEAASSRIQADISVHQSSNGEKDSVISTSVSNIITAAIVTVKTLQDTVRRYRGRNRTLGRLQDAVNDLINILTSLEEIDHNEAPVLALLRGPISRCTQVSADFENAMRTFSTKSNSTSEDWAKMEYIRGDINDFIDTLADYKSTITIGLGTITLHTVKFTQKVVEEYNEMVKDTAYNLEMRLQRIDEKIMGFAACQSNNLENSEVDLHNEKAVTLQCLRICELASSYIRSLQVAQPALNQEAKQQSPVTMLEQFEAQSLTQKTLTENRDKLMEVIGHLRARLDNMIDEDGLDREEEMQLLQQELDYSKQCLDVCSEASNHLDGQKTHIIEKVVVEDDYDQVVVTALADLFNVGLVKAKERSMQLVDSIPAGTLQQMSKDRYSSRFGAVDGYLQSSRPQDVVITSSAS